MTLFLTQLHLLLLHHCPLLPLQSQDHGKGGRLSQTWKVLQGPLLLPLVPCLVRWLAQAMAGLLLL